MSEKPLTSTEKFNLAESLRQLLYLALTAPPDDFPYYVDRLLNSIPRAWRDQRFEEDLLECVYETEKWVYKKFCGVDLGSPEHPVAGSPQLVREQETSWEGVLQAIIDLLFRRRVLGSTLKTEILMEGEE